MLFYSLGGQGGHASRFSFVFVTLNEYELTILTQEPLVLHSVIMAIDHIHLHTYTLTILVPLFPRKVE